MSELNYLTFSQFNSIAQSKLSQFLPSIDPTVSDSAVNVWLTSEAAMTYSVQQLVKQLHKQLFPQTATGDWLDIWATYEGMSRLSASASSGTIIQEGDADTEISSGSEYTTTSGYTFSVDTTAIISETSTSISSITRSGTTATATTSSDHGLATGMSVTIAGCDQDDYNDTFTITVISSTEFTFEVENSPTTPATGDSITATDTYASLDVTCESTGSDTNVDSGATLTLSTSITGADSGAFPTYDGLSGGEDEEDDETLRSRVIESRGELEGVFTKSQIELAAKKIDGNTRVYVITPEYEETPSELAVGTTPGPGQVIVYILRDNDSSIIPTQKILDKTKEAIIEDGALPANMSEDDLGVFAPNTTEVDFEFASISPDTTTMRKSIKAQLEALFEESVELETDVAISKIYATLYNTQDSSTGDTLDSFELTSPSANISVADGSIAILGTITYDS